jgi:transcriptional regulator with XRE-family HTH domain
MKMTFGEAIKRLRKILERSQAEFAVLCGISADVIKNLESGRTAEIKAEDAQLIFAATGAEFSKSGVRYWKTKEPYTLEHWVDWTRTTGNTCESLARAFAKDASEKLQALFLAAATPGPGKLKHRLPALWAYFQQWERKAKGDFRLRVN